MNMKSILGRFFGSVSPRIFFIMAYCHNRKKIPNLRYPKDLSEILIRRVLDGETNKLYYLADKYLVRKYIQKKGYGDLLTPLIGAFDRPEDIDFKDLPNKFAIKMNYGAGMNIICNDKSNFNVKSARKKLSNWMNSSKTYSYSEAHYNLIDRKIVVEEFIDDGNGGFPTDYKFMCVNGHVLCILACTGRESGHAFYAPFDKSWNRLREYDRREHGVDICIQMPENLGEMIKIAEILSVGFPFIRVDLYSNGHRIWFGEYTLTASGCILHGWTQRALDEMGKEYRKYNHIDE